MSGRIDNDWELEADRLNNDSLDSTTGAPLSCVLCSAGISPESVPWLLFPSKRLEGTRDERKMPSGCADDRPGGVRECVSGGDTVEKGEGEGAWVCVERGVLVVC